MKEPLSPQQLTAAREGDEPALAALIARFMPMIRSLARSAAGPGLDFEDAVQEGLIGLFSAVQRYRPEGGASFSTYASVCIRNAIWAAQRAASRKKHAPLNQSIPIPDEQSTPGPEELAQERERRAATLYRANSALSPFEKAVLRGYLAGLSYGQIAATLGCEEKSVDNALARIRRKLR